VARFRAAVLVKTFFKFISDPLFEKIFRNTDRLFLILLYRIALISKFKNRKTRKSLSEFLPENPFIGRVWQHNVKNKKNIQKKY